MVTQKNLLDTREAAEVLRLSPKTLECFRVTGGGPIYVKLSRKAVRYRVSDLENWISQRLRSSTSGSAAPQKEAA